MQRNDANIEKLKEEIVELQSRIKINNAQRGDKKGVAGAIAKTKRQLDDDDELLDTTSETVDVSKNWRLRLKMDKKNTLSSSSSKQALSYADLLAMTTQLGKDIEAVQIEREKLILEVSVMDLATNNSHEDFDVYVIQTQKKESTERIEKLRIQINELEIELARSKKLLNLATPSISSLLPQAPVINVCPSFTSSYSNS